MFIFACTVENPEAVAVIVVDPGENVVLNWSVAYVEPFGIVIFGFVTSPMLVRDDDRLMVMS